MKSFLVVLVVLGAVIGTKAKSIIPVGITRAEEAMALRFLKKYHYISPSESGNHDVKTAVENFQRFANLPVTGKIDADAIKQMKKSRCGMPDVRKDGDITKRYDLTGKWPKLHLKYSIEYGLDLSHADQDRIFAKAVKYWADVSGLSFSQVSDPNLADLKVSFGGGAHGGQSESTCAYPFDGGYNWETGTGGVLAHAFYPSDGRLHFDEDEKFTDGTYAGMNLLWVAVHEFGHALGLGHTRYSDAVMYPYYTGYKPNLSLGSDDIQGIQALYGSN